MLRTIVKHAAKSILILLVCTGLYLIAAFTLPHIIVNTDFQNAENGIKIFVISNGVHTDIVLPEKTEQKDWTQFFPKDKFSLTDSTYNYISFGWGDKGFYLNTPQWNDLTFNTAFKAAFGLSETAMHVRYLQELKNENKNCVILKLDSLRYNDLIKYIENSFDKKEGSVCLINHPGYGQFDRFYEANNRYSLFNTCNNWTNKAFKKIKVRTALWSPLSGGLMQSLKP